MRRLLTIGAILIAGLCAVAILGGASQTGIAGSPDESILYWHRGDTAKGNMMVDSCDTNVFDTSNIHSRQFGADSVLFRIYAYTADKTAASGDAYADTTWIIAEGLDKWWNVLDTSLLLVDTIDGAGHDFFSVWDTKCTYWPYMRLLRETHEDTATSGRQTDSIYGVFYPLEAR